VTKDVIPYGSVWGNHAHLEGLNLVGLKRRGFSRETINALRAAYRLLFADEGTFQERLDDVASRPTPTRPRSWRSSTSSGRGQPPAVPARTRSLRPVRKLGLIAGGGGLPVELADHCERAGRPLFVGDAPEGVRRVRARPTPAPRSGIAELGKCFKALRAEGCEGRLLRRQRQPPGLLQALIPDLRGMAVLPGAIAAAAKGDDALLRRCWSASSRRKASTSRAPTR
jgi:hypothetical protein